MFDIQRVGVYYRHPEVSVTVFRVTGENLSRKLINDAVSAYYNERDTGKYNVDLLASELAEKFHRTCYHTHDCCGCWHSGSIRIIDWDAVYKAAVCEVVYHQNV
jgi:hypothetical protein